MDSKNSKNNTILIWFDAGSYTYIHFGIIHALSKLGNFDFVGIVATQQDVDFLKKQNLINFKKLFYYPECYISKSEYNSTILKEFEKKYELCLWQDVLSDRFFYKFYTFFHNFKRNEILPIVENSLLFFVDILKKFDPKLVLMQTAGENFSNILLYRLAKKLEFEVLMTNWTHLHDRITLSNNLISREISEEFQMLNSNPNNHVDEYDLNFIKNQSHTETIKIQSNFIFDNSTLTQKISHYVKRLFHDPEPIYQNFGHSKLKMLQFKCQFAYEIKKRQQFLDSNASKSIKDENFFYFPLHTDPEAKYSTTSPFITDQITLIKNIAQSIPINFSLYVKEHPIQKYKFWRSIQDYKKILDMPNVKLIHPSISSHDLISKSKGVIAIGGSVGFDALFYKKPVFLFSDEYYDVVSMVKKIEKISDLPSIINTTIKNFQFKNSELNVIIQATENVSIPFRYSSVMKNAILLSSIQRNTNNTKITFNHFQNFYTDFESDFELLAKKIYERIKY